jgi:hypothetical protein
LQYGEDWESWSSCAERQGTWNARRAQRRLPAAAGGWTTDDLDALPEDGQRRELLDGALIMSPSPTGFHQIIAVIEVNQPWPITLPIKRLTPKHFPAGELTRGFRRR